ncbi:MAG: magnesium transporter [Candidatus Marinimicrobia bacterium]|nr:magnesium transporter [Candidatus Neomarinimicrobiota bacterium]
MMDREFIVLLSSFRRLLRRNANNAVKKMIKKTHPADLAKIFRSFTDHERRAIFDLIQDVHYKAELIAELDSDIFHELLVNFKTEKIKELIVELPGDDQADVLDRLPDEIEQDVIELMNSKESREIDELLKYSPESAGGLMVTLPFKMHEDSTVKEAIETVQAQEDMELVFYIYIVDQDNRLTGVLSLRELLSASPEDKLKKIMRTDLITVDPTTDQEVVARIVSRYDFMAIPVVDDKDHLLGIITVDDIIDVIREEATEDFLQMVGAGRDREILFKSTFEEAKLRFPWLFATWIGGVVASGIVNSFGDLLKQVVALAAFMPIIAGMGGNIGTQSATIVIRGLTTGRVDLREIGKVIFKEIRVGLTLGFAYGLGLAILVQILYPSAGIMVGIVVGLGIGSVMLLAAFMGTIAPLLLDKFKTDPAVATGPFVTTSIDILGMLIYFSIATALL